MWKAPIPAAVPGPRRWGKRPFQRLCIALVLALFAASLTLALRRALFRARTWSWSEAYYYAPTSPRRRSRPPPPPLWPPAEALHPRWGPREPDPAGGPQQRREIDAPEAPRRHRGKRLADGNVRESPRGFSLRSGPTKPLDSSAHERKGSLTFSDPTSGSVAHQVEQKDLVGEKRTGSPEGKQKKASGTDSEIQQAPSMTKNWQEANPQQTGGVKDAKKPDVSEFLEPKRFEKPFYKYSDLYPDATDRIKFLSRRESRNRVFISTMPHNIRDGLGHKTLILSTELLLAHRLNLSYAHRVSEYGSITKDDKLAVENFFGWSDGQEMFRHSLLDRECAQRITVKDQCGGWRVGCAELRPNSTFERIVTIPRDVSMCLVKRGNVKGNNCTDVFEQFIELHNEPNTLFQPFTDDCFWKLYWPSFNAVRSFFFTKYWHRRETTPSRRLNWDTQAIHIAVHIRRGDFFRVSHRKMIPDEAYGAIVRRVMELIDLTAPADRPFRYHVHIYSQGKHKGRKWWSHDIDEMGKAYVSESGEEKPGYYWMDMLGRKRLGSRLRVSLHISEDTLKSIDGMVSADIFVGSESGLSHHVVQHLSRGILMMPKEISYLDPTFAFVLNVDSNGKGVNGGNASSGKKTDLYFNVDKFSKIWAEYRGYIERDLQS